MTLHRLRQRIGNPEIAHGVDSPEAYREHARVFLAKAGMVDVLHEVAERPAAFVSDGRWVCGCACGNGPSAHPEWGLAICLECGAVLRPRFPRDWRVVETVLLERPEPHQRHHFPDDEVARAHGLERRERLANLRAENRTRGQEA